MVTGAAMLAWCAWVLVDASRSQQAGRRSLESVSLAYSADSPSGLAAPAGVVADARATPRGSAIATLTISRIGLSAVVLHGSDARTLRRGPGHVERTAFPGEQGNVVIAGHRDTFFRPLRRIQVGDDIVLETPRGRFEYRVSSLRVTTSDDLGVLEQAGRDVLTLITCYPFNLVGSAPDRFVVRATRRMDPAPGTPSATETQQQAVDPAQAAPVVDEAALVRGAIERFRTTYNARLVSHGELRGRGLLQLQRCQVVVTGPVASAACGASSEASDDGTAHGWTFTLARDGAGWAIRSVAID